MDWFNDWVENYCKPHIVEVQKTLEPYLDGTMRVGQREHDGEWEDITNQMVAEYKAEIATYKNIIAKHEASKG